MNIKLRITYSHGWPFVDIVPSNNPMTLSNTSGIDMDSYYYYDKKSFINLSKRHATEWDKLVRFGLTK